MFGFLLCNAPGVVGDTAKKIWSNFFFHVLSAPKCESNADDLFTVKNQLNSSREKIEKWSIIIICVHNIHCVKSVQIRSYFCSVFSPNTGKFGPEITLHLDNFHAVIAVTKYLRTSINEPGKKVVVWLDVWTVSAILLYLKSLVL